MIVNLGHDVIEKPPLFMKPGGPEVIHVNFRSAELDPIYFPQIKIVSDIVKTFWPIQQTIAAQQHWDSSRVDRIRRAAEANLLLGADDERFPVYPQRLVAQVRKVMPSDGIVALDNGVYKLWFARNYKAHVANSVLLDNALVTMGAGLPSAMAARLVHPQRKIMAIGGDGGFMMNSLELETAVRLKMHLLIIILRDDAYGRVRWKQANMGFDDWGLTYGKPDCVRYVESYGGLGHRVACAAELGPLLATCLAGVRT